MTIDADIYPVGLVVAGRPCLVVGGGRVAARKVAGLLRCGASVTMVAPDVDVAVRLLERAPLGEHASTGQTDAPGPAERLPARLQVAVRRYRRGEAGRYRLVVAATGIAEVDRAVHDDAEAAGVWVNCADDGAHCTAILPAVHRDGSVTVAVSTGGASPALASWIRRRIDSALGSHLGALAELLDEARHRIHQDGRSTELVDWAALLDGPLPDLVRQGRADEARALVEEAIGLPLPRRADLVPAGRRCP